MYKVRGGVKYDFLLCVILCMDPNVYFRLLQIFEFSLKS